MNELIKKFNNCNNFFYENIYNNFSKKFYFKPSTNEWISNNKRIINENVLNKLKFNDIAQTGGVMNNTDTSIDFENLLSKFNKIEINEDINENLEIFFLHHIEDLNDILDINGFYTKSLEIIKENNENIFSKLKINILTSLFYENIKSILEKLDKELVITERKYYCLFDNCKKIKFLENIYIKFFVIYEKYSIIINDIEYNFYKILSHPNDFYCILTDKLNNIITNNDIIIRNLREKGINNELLEIIILSSNKWKNLFLSQEQNGGNICNILNKTKTINYKINNTDIDNDYKNLDEINKERLSKIKDLLCDIRIKDDSNLFEKDEFTEENLFTNIEIMLNDILLKEIINNLYYYNDNTTEIELFNNGSTEIGFKRYFLSILMKYNEKMEESKYFLQIDYGTKIGINKLLYSKYCIEKILRENEDINFLENKKYGISYFTSLSLLYSRNYLKDYILSPEIKNLLKKFNIEETHESMKYTTYQKENLEKKNDFDINSFYVNVDISLLGLHLFISSFYNFIKKEELGCYSVSCVNPNNLKMCNLYCTKNENKYYFDSDVINNTGNQRKPRTSRKESNLIHAWYTHYDKIYINNISQFCFDKIIQSNLNYNKNLTKSKEDLYLSKLMKEKKSLIIPNVCLTYSICRYENNNYELFNKYLFELLGLDITKKIIHQRPHFMYNNVKTTSLYNCDSFVELKEKISSTTIKNNHIKSKRN
jgi:hypothetical protein